MGHFLDYSRFVTADGAELHVEEAGWDGASSIFVCSPTPLNKRQTAKAVRVAITNFNDEMILEELKDGKSPAQVWNDGGYSAAHINRVAKKHGIKLPRGWFSVAFGDKSLSRNQERA